MYGKIEGVEMKRKMNWNEREGRTEPSRGKEMDESDFFFQICSHVPFPPSTQLDQTERED